MNWRPIETAPKDGRKFIGTDGTWSAVGYFEEGGREFAVHHFAVCQEYAWRPTHWMPLPEPPEDA